jgi:hypothetical protein
MNTRTTNLHIVPMPAGLGARVEVTSGAEVALLSSLTTSTSPLGTRYIVWQVQTGGLYVTFDGTTPSATNGFSYAAGTSGEWDIAMARVVKAIAASATGYIYFTPGTD